MLQQPQLVFGERRMRTATHMPESKARAPELEVPAPSAVPTGAVEPPSGGVENRRCSVRPGAGLQCIPASGAGSCDYGAASHTGVEVKQGMKVGGEVADDGLHPHVHTGVCGDQGGLLQRRVHIEEGKM